MTLTMTTNNSEAVRVPGRVAASLLRDAAGLPPGWPIGRRQRPGSFNAPISFSLPLPWTNPKENRTMDDRRCPHEPPDPDDSDDPRQYYAHFSPNVRHPEDVDLARRLRHVVLSASAVLEA